MTRAARSGDSGQEAEHHSRQKVNAVGAKRRRLIRPADAPRLSPIRSLAYFRPVIDELLAHPAPESYLDYLRLKLRQGVRRIAGG